MFSTTELILEVDGSMGFRVERRVFGDGEVFDKKILNADSGAAVADSRAESRLAECANLPRSASGTSPR